LHDLANPVDPDRDRDRIYDRTRSSRIYNRIAASAEIVLPFLSPERQARIWLTMALTERGLLAARDAATAAEQAAAIVQAQSATAVIVAIVN
jgi:hypothetical protein